MRVLTAVGARPQLIKAAPLHVALRARGIDELIVHSGQHYDHAMSQVFFDELGLPAPALNLGVSEGSHGAQTGRMLEGYEAAIQRFAPDLVMVHGDTNSTLAAALAAAKLGVKLAHNEAGLRSFDRSMPEEHNRVLTDHCADLLFCTSERAALQLAREGLDSEVHVVGDLMYDAALRFAARASSHSQVLERLQLSAADYALATLHRPHNVDRPERLRALLSALEKAPCPVLLPAHPRLVARLREQDLQPHEPVRLCQPLGYLEMMQLERHARFILTDSGGVQKEAYFHAVPCITLRAETEWTETVESGWNQLADADEARILAAMQRAAAPAAHPPLFGDGHAADRIADILLRKL